MDVAQFIEYLEQLGHGDETTFILRTESGESDAVLTITLGEFKRQFNAYKIY